MSLIKSLVVWFVTYSAQCFIGNSNHWHLTSTDYYMFYGVATLMMVISYITGRIEEIKEDD